MISKMERFAKEQNSLVTVLIIIINNNNCKFHK